MTHELQKKTQGMNVVTPEHEEALPYAASQTQNPDIGPDLYPGHKRG